ncbi:hypothetical protein F4678DRAFT_463969 [Xylaria arbuscula]|nr:hypothetical protein F4678DRAFT_463969 [Xylaria arbuscula]
MGEGSRGNANPEPPQAQFEYLDVLFLVRTTSPCGKIHNIGVHLANVTIHTTTAGEPPATWTTCVARTPPRRRSTMPTLLPRSPARLGICARRDPNLVSIARAVYDTKPCADVVPWSPSSQDVTYNAVALSRYPTLNHLFNTILLDPTKRRAFTHPCESCQSVDFKIPDGLVLRCHVFADETSCVNCICMSKTG